MRRAFRKTILAIALTLAFFGLYSLHGSLQQPYVHVP